MHPIIDLSIVFWLYTALPYRNSMPSNPLVFQTSGVIWSSPVAFLFWIVLCTELSSSCINCPSLMSSWLQIICVVGFSVTFGGFLRNCSKYCFRRCIRSSWLASFSLVLTVLFLLLTSFTVCFAILDCLSSTASLILLIWFLWIMLVLLGVR